MSLSAQAKSTRVLEKADADNSSNSSDEITSASSVLAEFQAVKSDPPSLNASTVKKCRPPAGKSVTTCDLASLGSEAISAPFSPFH